MTQKHAFGIIALVGILIFGALSAYHALAGPGAVGRIVFSDVLTFKGQHPRSDFGPYEEFAYVAHFSQSVAPNSPSVRETVSSLSTGREIESTSYSVIPANCPTMKLCGDGLDPQVLIHDHGAAVPGRYVVRFYDGDTELAEGTFSLRRATGSAFDTLQYARHELTEGSESFPLAPAAVRGSNASLQPASGYLAEVTAALRDPAQTPALRPAWKLMRSPLRQYTAAFQAMRPIAESSPSAGRAAGLWRSAQAHIRQGDIDRQLATSLLAAYRPPAR